MPWRKRSPEQPLRFARSATSGSGFFSFWQSGFRHRLGTAFLAQREQSLYRSAHTANTESRTEREGDTLRWKITVAINGRPIAEEALKNTIAASERFDEIVAQVKARLSPR